MKLFLKDLIMLSVMLFTVMVILKATWSLTPFWIKKVVLFSCKSLKSLIKLTGKLITLSYRSFKVVLMQLYSIFKYCGLLIKKKKVAQTKGQPTTT